MEIAVYSMRPCLSVDVDDIYVLKASALPIDGNTKPAKACCSFCVYAFYDFLKTRNITCHYNPIYTYSFIYVVIRNTVLAW